MAQNGRTEKATPKRKREEKNKGNLARSKELGTFFNVASFSIILMLFGNWFVNKIIGIQQLSLALLATSIQPLDYFKELSVETGKVFLYIAFVGIVFQMINQMIQVGFLFSPKIIKPDFKKMNPVNYFKGIFSKRSLVEISKSLLIFSILSYIIYAVLKDQVAEMTGGMLLPWNQSLSLLWGVFVQIIKKILLALLFIGLLDYFYQRYDYANRIKMSKQDVKDEHRQNEGSPEMKRKQRQMAITLLTKEIKTKVPESTLIITNPTHYSIALRYKRGEGPPKVLVKAVDYQALYIRELAKEHNIPIYEAPPLAREIYRRVGENEFIPQDLFQAVIDIMKVLNKMGKLKI